jgi:hypothetical protein
VRKSAVEISVTPPPHAVWRATLPPPHEMGRFTGQSVARQFWMTVKSMLEGRV